MKLIGDLLKKGGFGSPAEVVVAGLESLKARQKADDESIRRGIADAEAGRTQPVDRAIEELIAELKG